MCQKFKIGGKHLYINLLDKGNKKTPLALFFRDKRDLAFSFGFCNTYNIKQMEAEIYFSIQPERDFTGYQRSDVKLLGGESFKAEELMTLFQEREWSVSEVFGFLNQIKELYKVNFFCFHPQITYKWICSGDEQPQLNDVEKSMFLDCRNQSQVFFPIYFENTWMLFRFKKFYDGIKAYYCKSLDVKKSLDIAKLVEQIGIKICKFIKTNVSVQLTPFHPRKFGSSSIMLIYFFLKLTGILANILSDQDKIDLFINHFYSEILPFVILSCKSPILSLSS